MRRKFIYEIFGKNILFKKMKKLKKIVDNSGH